MMKPAIVSILTMAATLCQSAPPRPAFEVASVKMYGPDAVVPEGAQGFTSSADGIRAIHVTVRGLLQGAYGIVDVHGPAWINQESYDIIAKAAGPVPPEQLTLMLQILLEDRFKLKLHRETKQAPVGVLVASKKGIKNLHAVENDGRLEIKRDDGKLKIKSATMSNIAGVMGSPFGNMPLEKVVDETGLAGRYDITLDLKDFDPGAPEFAGKYQEMRAALFAFVSEALEKNYGLELERRMMPLETLIVDDGSKTPTEN